nr:MFS transporter [Jiangella mangrovi]
MGLGAIELGLVFTGWGLLVAVFSVFGAPWLQRRLGIARTLYANLACFAVVVLVIAIWTDHVPVLVTAVIVAGVFIGINNTVTTQAVMTVSPVDRPVASAAYGFVRFIGGGLAPFAAGKLVEATNVHVPFFLGAAVLLVGIAILATARDHLAVAERVQAGEPIEAPAPRLEAVGPDRSGHDGVIVAAVSGADGAEVARVAARLATLNGRTVDVLHAQEAVLTGEGAVDGEDDAAARATVRQRLDEVSALGVPAVGHLLRGAAGHGTVGRLIAEHAEQVGARAIVIGTPSHGGLAALMDESATQELWRHAHCHIVIVNDDSRV